MGEIFAQSYLKYGFLGCVVMDADQNHWGASALMLDKKSRSGLRILCCC